MASPVVQPYYIEIGTVCTNFQETRPSDIQKVYISTTNALTAPILKSTGGAAATDSSPYSAISGGGLTAGTVTVNYSDYIFDVIYDEALARASSGQNNWRRLVPTGSSGAQSSSKTIVQGTTPPWPMTGGDVVNFAVTYENINYVVNKVPFFTGSTPFENLLKTLIPFPSSVPNTSTKFFLTDGTNRYVYYDSGSSTFKATDFSSTFVSPAEGTNYTGFYFTYKSVGTTPIIGQELTISLTPGGGAFPSGVSAITYPGGKHLFSFTSVSGTFQITTATPTAGITVAEQAAEITMIRRSTDSKYFAWNSSTGSPAFSLVNYWGDSLSLTDIRQKLQFYFQDLTLQDATSPTGGAIDYYKWNLLTNAAAITPIATDLGAALYVTGTTTLSFTTTAPANPTREGWAFNATGGVQGAPYHLIYVRLNATTGQMEPVAYINESGTLVAVNSLANLPAAAKVWQCIKCTPAAGTGVCSTTPGSVIP